MNLCRVLAVCRVHSWGVTGCCRGGPESPEQREGAGQGWGVEMTFLAESACLCCCWAGEVEASGLGELGAWEERGGRWEEQLWESRYKTNFRLVELDIQSLSSVQLFATPWTLARQASLSFTMAGVCSNSCPSSWWCHPTISVSVIPFSSRLQSFPALGSFQMSQFFAWGSQSTGCFSFSISSSSEYSGLISFRMDWFDLLAVRGTLKSLLQHHFESIMGGW